MVCPPSWRICCSWMKCGMPGCHFCMVRKNELIVIAYMNTHSTFTFNETLYYTSETLSVRPKLTLQEVSAHMPLIPYDHSIRLAICSHVHFHKKKDEAPAGLAGASACSYLFVLDRNVSTSRSVGRASIAPGRLAVRAAAALANLSTSPMCSRLNCPSSLSRCDADCN